VLIVEDYAQIHMSVNPLCRYNPDMGSVHFYSAAWFESHAHDDVSDANFPSRYEESISVSSHVSAVLWQNKLSGNRSCHCA
jgi:hypothetical protein